ncbi:MAG: hypothetical protein AABY22_16855 [Nanoarchaeota archaeon]
MIHPLLTRGRFLFLIDSCPFCRIYKRFLPYWNMQLKPDKRIRIIDCTMYNEHGIITNPIIKLFEPYLEAYPTLFFEGMKREGANSVVELIGYLKVKVFPDFIFEQENEWLPEIKKNLMFNVQCKKIKGRVYCH